MDKCKPLARGRAADAGAQRRVARCGGAGAGRGRAVQFYPGNPKFKPSGTKHLKLKRDILLSISPFKFKLRRYTVEGFALGTGSIDTVAGAETCPLLSST